jgi:hypothetical protein
MDGHWTELLTWETGIQLQVIHGRVRRDLFAFGELEFEPERLADAAHDLRQSPPPVRHQ